MPSFEEDLKWSTTLVEKATKVEDGMYKRTSCVEVAYILRRVLKEKASRLAEVARAAKAGKGKGKAEDET